MAPSGTSRLQTTRAELQRLLVTDESLTNYRAFCHHVVFSDSELVFDFMKEPLRDLLLVLHDPRRLHAAGDIFSFMLRLVDLDAPIDRLACSLLPSVEQALPTTPHVLSICHLLHRLTGQPEARIMMSNPLLAERLCARLLDEWVDLAVRFFVAAEFHRSAAMALTCIEGVWRLVHDVRRQRHTVLAPLFRLWCEVVRVTDDVRPLLSLHLFWIVRKGGWFEECGEFLAAMLRGTSVRLILDLDSRGFLDSLVVSAHAFALSAAIWREVLSELRRQWPARATGLAPPVSERPVTRTLCPITLERMIYPVVASDGHAYERDAIMRHLATHPRRLSPLTQQPLGDHLFPNFASPRD